MKITKKHISTAVGELRKNGVEGPYKMYIEIYPYGIVLIKGKNANTMYRQYKRYCRKAIECAVQRGEE